MSITPQLLKTKNKTKHSYNFFVPFLCKGSLLAFTSSHLFTRFAPYYSPYILSIRGRANCPFNLLIPWLFSLRNPFFFFSFNRLLWEVSLECFAACSPNSAQLRFPQPLVVHITSLLAATVAPRPRGFPLFHDDPQLFFTNSTPAPAPKPYPPAIPSHGAGVPRQPAPLGSLGGRKKAALPLTASRKP